MSSCPDLIRASIDLGGSLEKMDHRVKPGDDDGCTYPPLEGEGRFACSEAKCETGWGDSLSTCALFERRDRHPPPPRVHARRPSPSRGG